MGFVFSMQLQCKKLADGTSLISYTHHPSTYDSLLPHSLTITRHVRRYSHLQCSSWGPPMWLHRMTSHAELSRKYIGVDTNTTNHTLKKPDKALYTSFTTNLFEHMLPLRLLQKNCAACSLMTGLYLWSYRYCWLHHSTLWTSVAGLDHITQPLHVSGEFCKYRKGTSAYYRYLLHLVIRIHVQLRAHTDGGKGEGWLQERTKKATGSSNKCKGRILLE